MKNRLMSFTVAAALTAVALPAHGIIIRHDRDESDYRDLGSRYPAVGRIDPDGTGTLIAPRWVLTAAHVARAVRRHGGSVRFGQRRYEVEAAVLHPEWKGEGDVQDIGLLRLAEPVEGIEPVGIYDRKDEDGREVTFVGYGDFGTGLTGPQRMDGVLRGATNTVDAVEKQAVLFTFDEPGKATELEGVSGPGDSGGPALIERDGRLWTIGVSSMSMGRGEGPGRYGVRERYTRVSAYAKWIRQTLKEPPSAP